VCGEKNAPQPLYLSGLVDENSRKRQGGKLGQATYTSTDKEYKKSSSQEDEHENKPLVASVHRMTELLSRARRARSG